MRPLLLAFLLLVLQACDSNKYNLLPIPESGTILAFGDSLTAGKGVDKKYSYPSVLSSLSERKVINAGVSGEVTGSGLKRLAGVLEKEKPDLMILLEGGNDILRNQNLVQTKANLNAMIQLAEEQGVQVVLIGVPQKALFASGSAPLYEQLAEENNLVFEGGLISDLLHDRSLKSDSVHFNKFGYQKMAKKIHQVLVENGALL